MSISKDSCRKAMKEIFFQSNHVESNYWKDAAAPFLLKNGCIIPHLWNVTLLKNNTILSIFITNKSFYDILPFGQVYCQMINLSEDILKRIKELFIQNAISQDPLFASISLLIQF